MTPLLELAQKHHLKIIEDCAQAHGAEYQGRRVGTLGDIGTFSFYPGKNLGAYGDGGAIVTNDSELALKCQMIADHGRIKKYDHEFAGRNSRLDGLQAAILEVKLKHLENWISKRNQIAQLYTQHLKDHRKIKIPLQQPHVRHSYHLYVIRTPKRDELQKYLTEHQIQTGIHYPISLTQSKAYQYVHQAHEKMFVNQIGSELLSLPIGEHLTITEVNTIISALWDFKY